MATVDEIVKVMEAGSEVRYSDLYRVCEHHFGAGRQQGTSHAIFKTPWVGNPRINIQNDKGKAKPYQVRQVLAAIAKLEQVRAEAAKRAAEAADGDQRPDEKKSKKK